MCGHRIIRNAIGKDHGRGNRQQQRKTCRFTIIEYDKCEPVDDD